MAAEPLGSSASRIFAGANAVSGLSRSDQKTLRATRYNQMFGDVAHTTP